MYRRAYGLIKLHCCGYKVVDLGFGISGCVHDGIPCSYWV